MEGSVGEDERPRSGQGSSSEEGVSAAAAVRGKKVVVVGDGGVGKTSILMGYSGKPYSDVYVPTVFDNFTTRCRYGAEEVMLSLWDTAGQEDYDRVRIMTYDGTDLFLVCFSVADSFSASNVRDRWLPELKQYFPDKPLRWILIGTKQDMRGQAPQSPGSQRTSVSYDEGYALAEELGALVYMECSAISGSGIKAIFDEVVHQLYDPSIQLSLESAAATSPNPSSSSKSSSRKKSKSSKNGGGCVLF